MVCWHPERLMKEGNRERERGRERERARERERDGEREGEREGEGERDRCREGRKKRQNRKYIGKETERERHLSEVPYYYTEGGMIINVLPQDIATNTERRFSSHTHTHSQRERKRERALLLLTHSHTLCQSYPKFQFHLTLISRKVFST